MRNVTRLATALVMVAVAAASVLSAQCPNGSPLQGISRREPEAA